MKIVAYVLAVAGAAAVLLLLLWSQQRRLLYFPEPDPGLPPTGWAEVTIQTESGLPLAARHREAQRGNAVAIVVVFPGNGGNCAGRVPLGDALSQRGFEVLLVDYRGYGGNPDSSSEHGLGESQNVTLSYNESGATYLGRLIKPETQPRR
jgi:pimeloyl-ACP methyl ester carboxylesterase